MSETKKRILETSLKLFNDYGLSKVTLRTIAATMKISQGNLNYHYRKREEIITALYFELVQSIDAHLQKSKEEEITLKALFESSTVVITNFYHYRFFLLDFVQIMRDHANVREHYHMLTVAREKEFVNFFMELVKKGVLRNEELSNEYLNLYKRYQIAGDFWMSFVQVTGRKITTQIISDYKEIALQAIYPYLTSKGKLEFKCLYASK